MTDHESGGVQPLRPDGTVDTELIESAVAPRRSNRAKVVGGIVVGVLAIGAIGAVIAWRTLVGSAFASAEAVPIDADFVMTFDLLQVRDSEKVDRLVQAFTVPAAEQGLIDDGNVDVLDRFDEQMDEAMGMTLREDVIPWIGRSVSLAVWIDGSISLEDMDRTPSEEFVGGVLVAGVRNGDRAADFVDEAAGVVARETDGLIEKVPFEGGTMTSVTGAEEPGENVFMWLDNDMMIVGMKEADIARALDAREGESILDDDDYDRMMAELPSDRLMAMYVGSKWLANIYDDPTFMELGAQAEAIRDSIESFSGVGMAMTLRDEGVSFDLAYAVDDPDALPLSSFDASGLDFIDRLPDDTLFHLAFPIADNTIADAIDPLREADPELYQEAADAADEFLGVDLFNEVLPSLGREAVFAIVPTPEGFFAGQFDFGIGGVIAVGVEDRGPVATAIDSLEDYAVENGISVTSLGEVSVIGADGSDYFAYSLGDDALAVGTGPTIVNAIINGVSPSVADNPRYDQLDRVLPGSGVPFFVDLQGIFDAFDFEGDERELVNALQAVGASGEISGDVVKFSVLVTIDY